MNCFNEFYRHLRGGMPYEMFTRYLRPMSGNRNEICVRNREQNGVNCLRTIKQRFPSNLNEPSNSITTAAFLTRYVTSQWWTCELRLAENGHGDLQTATRTTYPGRSLPLGINLYRVTSCRNLREGIQFCSHCQEFSNVTQVITSTGMGQYGRNLCTWN
jgi:hypothetical protein